MEKIRVYYKIAVEVEEEIEITEEEYNSLTDGVDGANVFFELEKRVTKKFKNYIKESFETMGTTY